MRPRNHLVVLLLILLVVLALLPQTFGMQQRIVAQGQIQNTGLFSPSQFANDQGNWVNGENAFADDEAYTYSTYQNDKAGRWYGYGFKVPSDAIITGVEVRVDAAGAVGVGWLEIEVFNGTQWSSSMGLYRTVPPRPTPLSTAKQTFILGGPNDLWGLTWTPNTANAIQVLVRVVHLNEVHVVWWLPVRIYYTMPESTATSTDTPTETPTITPSPSQTPTATPSLTPTLIPTSTSTPSGKALVTYFALGDSVASGHGLNSDDTDCHRSADRAYPYRVVRQAAQNYQLQLASSGHLACSGATAANVNSLGEKLLANQVQAALLLIKNEPTLISITIGANDLGWADPSFWAFEITERNERLFRSNIAQKVRAVRESVSVAVSALLNCATCGKVVIVVTGYFNPLNRLSPASRCGPIGTINCYTRFEYMMTTLNNSLRSVVRDFQKTERITFANVYDQFQSHAAPRSVCGFAAPGVNNTWIQYPSNTNYNSFALLPNELQILFGIVGQTSGGDCIHPNDQGALAYARAITEAASPLLNAIIQETNASSEIAPPFVPPQ